ncbi:MAG TPA: PepSY domain-containing protein [bacterium]|nr:PepSY domain-containing protein [bacterium]
MRSTMLETLAVGVVTGFALASGSPVLAQGTHQTTQVEQPTYACSIKVAPNANDASVVGQAKITLAQAQQVAQAAVPGTLLRSELDSENGCLVYSVEIRSATRTIHDVKVDAGTAKIVHQEIATRMGTEHEGASEQESGAED